MDGNPWGYGQGYGARSTRPSPPPAHGDISRFDMSLLDSATLNSGAYGAPPTHPAFGARNFTNLPQMTYGLSTLPQLFDPMSSIAQGFPYPYKTAFPSIETSHHSLEHVFPTKTVQPNTLPFSVPSTKSDYFQVRDHSGLMVQDMHGAAMMDPSKSWSLSNFLPTQTAPFSNLPAEVSNIPDLFGPGVVQSQRGLASERSRTSSRDSTSVTALQKSHSSDAKIASRVSSNSAAGTRFDATSVSPRLTSARQSSSGNQKNYSQSSQDLPRIINSEPGQPESDRTDLQPMMQYQTNSRLPQMRNQEEFSRNPSHVRRHHDSIRQQTDPSRPQQDSLQSPQSLMHLDQVRHLSSVKPSQESGRHANESVQHTAQSIHSAGLNRLDEPFQLQQANPVRQQSISKLSHGHATSQNLELTMQTELRIPSRQIIPESLSLSNNRKASHATEMPSPYGNILPSYKNISQESVASPPQDLSLKNQSLSLAQQSNFGIIAPSMSSKSENHDKQSHFFTPLSESATFPPKNDQVQIYPQMQLNDSMNYDPISPVSDTPVTDSYATVNIDDLSSAVRTQGMDTQLQSQPHPLELETHKVIQDLSNSYAMPPSTYPKATIPQYPPSLTHLSSVSPRDTIPITAIDVAVLHAPIQAVADSTTKTKKRQRKKKMTAEERQEAQIKALFDDDGYKPNLMTDDFLDQIQQQSAMSGVVSQDDIDKKKKRKRKKKKDDDIESEFSSLTQRQIFENPQSVMTTPGMSTQFQDQTRINQMTQHQVTPQAHPQAHPQTPAIQMPTASYNQVACEFRQKEMMSNPAIVNSEAQRSNNSTFMDQQKSMVMPATYGTDVMGAVHNNQMYTAPGPSGIYKPGEMPLGMGHGNMPLDQFGNPLQQDFMSMIQQQNMGYASHPSMTRHASNDLGVTSEQKNLPKAIIAPPELDNEFEHLAQPPKIPVQNENGPIVSQPSEQKRIAPRRRRNPDDIEQPPTHTIVLPDPLKPLPKAKTVFENSFLNFIQGDRGETLASLMDVSSRKSLPKHKSMLNLTKKIILPESPTWIEMSPEHEHAGDWVGFSDEECSFKKADKVAAVNKTPAPKVTKSNQKRPSDINADASKTVANQRKAVTNKKNIPLANTGKKHKVCAKDERIVEAPSDSEEEMQPSRVQTSRKAKEKAKRKTKIKKKRHSDESLSPLSELSAPDFTDDERAYDSDNDPAWTPFESGRSAEVDKSKRFRNRAAHPRTKSFTSHNSGHMPQTIKSFNEAQSAKQHDQQAAQQADTNNDGGGAKDKEVDEEGVETTGDVGAAMGEAPSKSAVDGDKYKIGTFLIEDKDMVNYDNYPLWLISDTKMLQKFEFTLEDGKSFHQSTFTYSSWVPAMMMGLFTPIQVKKLSVGVKSRPERVMVLEHCQPKPPSDGSLEEAYEDHPLVEMFNVYMQVFLSQALEPTFLCAIRDAKDEFYLHPLNRIDALIDQKVARITKKVNWKSQFKQALEDRPMLRELERPNLQQNCQVCSDGCQQFAVRSVHLFGAPYDRYTLEPVKRIAQYSSEEFLVGQVAGLYVGRFHKLRHYKHHLLQRCSAKVKLLREHNVTLDNPEILDKALQNRAWVLKLFEEIKKLLDVT